MIENVKSVVLKIFKLIQILYFLIFNVRTRKSTSPIMQAPVQGVIYEKLLYDTLINAKRIINNLEKYPGSPAVTNLIHSLHAAMRKTNERHFDEVRIILTRALNSNKAFFSYDARDACNVGLLKSVLSILRTCAQNVVDNCILAEKGRNSGNSRIVSLPSPPTCKPYTGCPDDNSTEIDSTRRRAGFSWSTRNKSPPCDHQCKSTQTTSHVSRTRSKNNPNISDDSFRFPPVLPRPLIPQKGVRSDRSPSDADYYERLLEKDEIQRSYVDELGIVDGGDGYEPEDEYTFKYSSPYI